jgi:hypothetical protein
MVITELKPLKGEEITRPGKYLCDVAGFSMWLVQIYEYKFKLCFNPPNEEAMPVAACGWKFYGPLP